MRVEIAIASNKAPVAGIAPSNIQDVTVVSERFVNDRRQRAPPCQPLTRTKMFLIEQKSDRGNDTCIAKGLKNNEN